MVIISGIRMTLTPAAMRAVLDATRDVTRQSYLIGLWDHVTVEASGWRLLIEGLLAEARLDRFAGLTDSASLLTGIVRVIAARPEGLAALNEIDRASADRPDFDSKTRLLMHLSSIPF